MTPQDFDFLRAFLRERSGLVLSADKQYLVESRLLPLSRKAGLADLAALVRMLRAGPCEEVGRGVVEAMTTRESLFFRDKVPFEQFLDVMLPSLMASLASRRRIRIWCAAASTGQEPYSLAMSLCEIANRLEDWRIEIVATDISNEVLAKARSGIYSQFEVQRGLPIRLLLESFTQVDENWQINATIRSMVQFRQLNLLDEIGHLGPFDIVFCRNVLIYFDQETKSGVLDRVAAITACEGYLVLGAAETVVGLTERFRPIPHCRGLYRPSTAAPGADALARARPHLRIVASA